jgi:hypothetical protein
VPQDEVRCHLQGPWFTTTEATIKQRIRNSNWNEQYDFPEFISLHFKVNIIFNIFSASFLIFFCQNIRTVLVIVIFLTNINEQLGCFLTYCDMTTKRQNSQSEEAVVARQRLDKPGSAKRDNDATKEELSAAVFSMPSFLSLYSKICWWGLFIDLSGSPRGGGFDYLHLSPVSRRKRRKGTQCLGV